MTLERELIDWAGARHVEALGPDGILNPDKMGLAMRGPWS